MIYLYLSFLLNPLVDLQVSYLHSCFSLRIDLSPKEVQACPNHRNSEDCQDCQFQPSRLENLPLH